MIILKSYKIIIQIVTSYLTNPGPLPVLELRTNHIKKDHPDLEIVSHLQQTLVTLGYDLGPYGTKKDDVA